MGANISFAKTATDRIFSGIGLYFLSPVFLWIAISIKREDHGPIFYRGERVGLNCRPFRIFKFRTMVVDADKLGGTSTSEDDPRITRVGRFLRRYKLDELPQLINVLLGDMSLVGPRPQVKWAVDLYSPEERAILSIRPGMTDYASLVFNNEEEILKGSRDPDRDYMEKIHPVKTQLQMKYVREHSLATDIGIILKTISAVLGKTGGNRKA